MPWWGGHAPRGHAPRLVACRCRTATRGSLLPAPLLPLPTAPSQRSLPNAPCRTPYKELTDEFGLPPVKKLWTAEQRLGGWKDIQRDFFDDTDTVRWVLTQGVESRLQ